MPTIAVRSPKSKITVTLSPDLVHQLDVFRKAADIGSRSLLVEEVLFRWLREQAQQDLERQTEDYYRSLSKAEQEDDQQWAKIAARSATRLWDK